MIIYGAKPKKNQGFLPSQPKRDEGGNVLIFILIAIILLGALTMTLLRSGQSTSDTADFERTSIVVSDILRYASGIKNAVTTLRQRGCSEVQISFEGASSHLTTDYINPNAPSDKSCHVFDVAGAGITYVEPPVEVRIPDPGGFYDYECVGSSFVNRECANWYFIGSGAVVGVGNFSPITNIRARELMMFYTNISEEACTEINRRLGITGIPVDSDGTYGQDRTFKGIYSNFRQIDPVALNGKKAGCVESTLSSFENYSFYQVLIAR